MTSSKLALVLVAAAGCGSSKSENAPAPGAAAPKVAEAAPPVLAAPVPDKASTTCGDGKLTVTLGDSSVREQERAIVFCKDDGTAAIQRLFINRGEVQDKKTVAISIDQWNEIWRLADAANWQSGTVQCAPEDDSHTVNSVDVFRAGTARSHRCTSDFAGPWKALSDAVFTSQGRE
jgi:hypothetical protein